MAAIPDNDDLFSLQFNIPLPHPRIRAVSNGSRRLMIHCSDDLAARWQANNPKLNQAAFELGLNLFIYATGKAELRTKTDSTLHSPSQRRPGQIHPDCARAIHRQLGSRARGLAEIRPLFLVGYRLDDPARHVWRMI